MSRAFVGHFNHLFHDRGATTSFDIVRRLFRSALQDATTTFAPNQGLPACEQNVPFSSSPAGIRRQLVDAVINSPANAVSSSGNPIPFCRWLHFDPGNEQQWPKRNGTGADLQARTTATGAARPAMGSPMAFAIGRASGILQSRRALARSMLPLHRLGLDSVLWYCEQ
jgi:hypothetical protein